MLAGEIGHITNNVVSDAWSMIQGVSEDYAAIQSTGAQWGLVTSDDVWSGAADIRFNGNIVSRRTDSAIDNLWPQKFGSLGYVSGTEFMDPNRIEDFSPHVIRTDNISWHFDSTNQGDGFGYVDPDRGLAEWYLDAVSSGVVADLVSNGVTTETVGTDDFDSAVYLFKNRKLNKWDERLTAPAVNAFIRAGYAIS